MRARHFFTAITTTVLIAGGLGAGSVSAGDSYSTPNDRPQKSTTCEGTVRCKILEGACDLVGGTYTGWESSDHGHTHGICTWPWE